MISAEDRNRLQSAPAFRRAVWGLRLLALLPLFALAIVILVKLKAAPAAGTPVFIVAFVSTAVGVGLTWSSSRSLEKVKRTVFPRYELDPIERSMIMNALLLRSMIRPNRGSKRHV